MKISLGELASTGTLLELSTCAADILRHLANDSATTTSASSAALLSIPAFSRRVTIQAASQTLETVLTYAVTQLAVWLETKDQKGSPRQMELDDEREVGEKRRRASIGVSGRVRRGEIVVDLKTLLTMSKPVVENARQQLKMESEGMIGLLLGFLERRVG